jgi:hypothetical protein
MSVSATRRQSVSVRRRPFPYIVLATLGALALFAVLVAIAVSNGNSASVGKTSLHAPRALPAVTAVGSTPGPGHK